MAADSAPLPLTAEHRVVLLAHGLWHDQARAKTAIQVLRYSPARVIAVIDPDHLRAHPEDATARVPGTDRAPVPIVANWEEACALGPDTPTHIIIGIAPPGGALPPAMRSDLTAAAVQGVPLISGLHDFLGDDSEIAPLARVHGATIIDLRRPPPNPVVARGTVRPLPCPVITTCATDSSSGKMTAAVALTRAAQEHGLRAAFVATGQTGLLLGATSGAPIDRCISDFAAGEVERQVILAAQLGPDGQATQDTPELIFVEGQGALSHRAYSPVTAAILHGSQPDALVLCHPAGRRFRIFDPIGSPWPVPAPQTERRLVEAFLAGHGGGQVACLSLDTHAQDAETAAATLARHEQVSAVPADDLIRNGPNRLLGAVLRHIAMVRPDKLSEKAAALARQLP